MFERPRADCSFSIEHEDTRSNKRNPIFKRSGIAVHNLLRLYFHCYAKILVEGWIVQPSDQSQRSLLYHTYQGITICHETRDLKNNTFLVVTSTLPNTRIYLCTRKQQIQAADNARKVRIKQKLVLGALSFSPSLSDEDSSLLVLVFVIECLFLVMRLCQRSRNACWPPYIGETHILIYVVFSTVKAMKWMIDYSASIDDFFVRSANICL